MCGDVVPQPVKITTKLANALQRQPVSGWTNLVFLASLGFTAYCLFGQHSLSVTTALVISFLLLLLRIFAEWCAGRNAG
jgi:hypothetical protein